MNTSRRETLSTKQVADIFHIKASSIRESLCRNEEWMGLRPTRLPNHRLIWDAAEVDRLLAGAEV